MRNKGIVFILVATFSFAIMNSMVKHLSGFHPFQVVFFRAVGTFALLLPMMLYQGASFVGKNPKILFLRGLIGLISLSTFFMAIQRIPLGSAVSIRYIGPIFGAVLAYFFLKEKIKAGQWWSFLIAFAGAIVLKGFDIRIDILSFSLLLISAVTVGGVFVLIRYLATREHYLTIISYFMLISIMGSLFFINHWRMPLGNEWYFVSTIGVFGWIGQLFMTRAFQSEETSVLAPFKYMELVYALIIGFFFFEESYSSMAFLGMGLIIVGMVLNVLVKRGGKKTKT